MCIVCGIEEETQHHLFFSCLVAIQLTIKCGCRHFISGTEHLIAFGWHCHNLFFAEFIIFFGIITGPKYLLLSKIVITFIMAVGMILTPIYLLSMLRQMFYGYKLLNAPNCYFFDAGPRVTKENVSALADR